LKQVDIHGHIPTVEAIDVADATVFGEVALKWSEITFELYRKLMNIYVLPHFGNIPIHLITGLDIEIFISKLKGESKSKQNILTPFRLVMKFARKHKIIQANPFDDVEPIKKTKGKQKGSLNLDEINDFIDALDDFWKPLFILLFFSGIRIAEASALKWKRVRFREGIIQIRKNLVWVRGKMIYKNPKTESSIRDVVLSKFVMDALREQRKRTWKGNGDSFVFLNRAGRPLNPHTLNKTVVRTTIEKIGINKKITVKDTRASYITNSLDQNERMSFIQRQVGHTTTRMIIDHYYRYTPAPDDGSYLEKAWNSTSILPEQEVTYIETTEKIG